jgi:hypothetical protein
MILLKFFLCLALLSWAAPENAPVINQVLFYESKQSWTARDLELFEKIKKEVLHKDRIGQFVENNDEDFILSRLSAREALLFEVSPVKLKMSDSQKSAFNGFSQKEIENELSEIGLAMSLIDLKESQLKQKLRFKTWLDLLKRKYQVKVKSPEFKP